MSALCLVAGHCQLERELSQMYAPVVMSYMDHVLVLS